MIINIEIAQADEQIVLDAYAFKFFFNLDVNSVVSELDQKKEFFKNKLLNDIKQVSDPHRIKLECAAAQAVYNAALLAARNSNQVDVVITEEEPV